MPTRSGSLTIWLFAFAALSLPAAPIAVLAADDHTPPRSGAGEAELAQLIAGRVMGTAQRCLDDSKRRNMLIVEDTAFVFRDGDTIYVNRPENAGFLDDFDAPVFRLYGSHICRLDQVEMRDRTSGIGGPVVILNEFIPYTRKQEAKP